MAQQELSLAQFATLLGEVAIFQRESKYRALDEAAKIIQKEAKRVIGTYDYGWPELAPSTQAERMRLGYAANEPLLRTGEMRDSIHRTVDADRSIAEVGSNSDIAVYQELGTSTIPPRSFLGAAAARMIDRIGKVIGQMMVEDAFGRVTRAIPFGRG